MFLAEFIGCPVDDTLIPVITTEVCIAVGGFHFDHAFTNFEDRYVERTTTQVDDEMTGKRTTHGARLSLWLELRDRQERSLRLASQAAIDAGATVELVRMQREIGDTVARVMIAFATEDVGLARDDPIVTEALPRRLLELSA